MKCPNCRSEYIDKMVHFDVTYCAECGYEIRIDKA